MKKIKKDILGWFCLIVIFMIIFSLYDDLQKTTTPTPSIINEGKNAKIPTELHPIVQDKTNQLKKRAEKRQIQIVITDHLRTMKEQNLLYAKGRSASGQVVTHAKAGESFHNYGLAIDFALKNKDGDIIWDMEYDGNNNGESDWLEVVDIAKELGFTWGGDWKQFKDYPHLQMDFGLSIKDLQQGKRPKDK